MSQKTFGVLLLYVSAASLMLIHNAAAQADLTINRSLLRASVLVEKQFFTTDDCNYVEGCLKFPGMRKLLKLDLGMVNLGPDDLVIGPPESSPHLFEWSPCHGHYHMKTIVKYRLLNLNFTKVVAGRKQAFCLRDNYPYST